MILKHLKSMLNKHSLQKKYFSLGIVRQPNSLRDGGQYRFPLIKRTILNHDTYIFKFGLPSDQQVLGLPIGGHLLFKMNNDGKQIARKYTPISRIQQTGSFDMLIKIYRPIPRFPQGGIMTQYLQGLTIGEEIRVQGPKGKYTYFGNGVFQIEKNGLKRRVTKQNIGLIGGGTGITPLYQVLNAIHTYREPEIKVSLIFANKTPDDILLKEELEQIENQNPNVNVYFTIDRQHPGWTGGVGFISEDMISSNLPRPGPNTMICHCGPGPMNEMVRKHLKNLGYTDDMIIKF